MKAEIICVGTELLLGDIINTNATWLANQLKELGIDLYYISTVGDNRGRMEALFNQASSRSDLVIVTGGLGPTEDDITREMIAQSAGVELVFHQELADELTERFKRFNRRMTENNLRQAYLPAGAEAIHNRVGTAPGVYLKTENTIFVALPGVPWEMEVNFREEVAPRLRKELPESQVIVSKMLRMCGIGESAMEDMVKDLMQDQSNPTLAPYAGRGESFLKVTAKAHSAEECAELMAPLVTEIYHRMSQYIFGENNDTLERVVGRLLQEQGLKLVTAESCTGGLIGHRITNIAGSSAYYERGFVTYSNEAKVEELGVPAEIISTHGAVSPETARAMVLGALEHSRADIAVAVTGIAGPDGGTAEKPVGLVYCGVGKRGEEPVVYDLHFSGERETIKFNTSQYAFYHIWKTLSGKI